MLAVDPAVLMMTRRVTMTGPADLDVAWQRYAEVARWSDWAPQIRRVETDGDVIAPGLTGVVRGPLGVGVDFRIDTVDRANRTWSWTARLAGVTVRMHHDLTATERGTVAGLTLEGPAPAVLGYGPVARIALRSLVSR